MILFLISIMENKINSHKFIITYHYYLALSIFGIYEILRNRYKKIYFKNQAILNKIPDLLVDGRLNEIIEEIKKVQVVPSQLIEKIFWRGVAKTYLKKSESAVIDFDSIEDTYKDYPNYNYAKALAYIDLNKFEDALELLNKAIISMPIAQFYDRRGVTYMMLEKFSQAESDLKESLNILEASYNTCNMGVLLINKGLYKKAIEYFDKTIKIDPKHSTGFLNRGICKCEMGNINNGLIDLKKALDLGNDKAKSLIEKFENE